MSLESLRGKVEQLIEKADSKGIILSGFSGIYYLPTVADCRSLPGDPSNPNNGNTINFAYMFWNYSPAAKNGYYVSLKTVYLPDWISTFGLNMFNNCGNLTEIYGDFSNVTYVATGAFLGCSKLPQLPYMPNLTRIDGNAFKNCTGLTSVTFYTVLTSLASGAFNGCTNITDIYCPWAEGEVANAPWGATNATIHYNHTAEV